MVTDIIDSFRKKQNIEHIIGFCGASNDSNRQEVEKVIEDSMYWFKGKDIAILTGGTVFGAIKYANEVAKDYGLKTIGILPERGEKYCISSLDLKVSVPPKYGTSEFGDESEIFAKAIDGMEIIGGNTGTAIEFFHALKINERRLNPKYDEVPIIIAPINSIEGFGQMVYSLPQIKDMPKAMPKKPLSCGNEAAKFLLYKLNGGKYEH